jgi:hypothetical protein
LYEFSLQRVNDFGNGRGRGRHFGVLNKIRHTCSGGILRAEAFVMGCVDPPA